MFAIKRVQLQERLMFLCHFFRAPGQIGSVTPSSRYLARTMLEQIDWSRVRAAAELGAGTGAITRYMQAYVNIQKTKVLLFEKDDRLRGMLEHDYPDFAAKSDCGDLLADMRDEGVDQLDCIVSGLPFFNFPQAERDRLMNAIVSSLKPGGQFVAFQYSRQMKAQLERHLEIERIVYVPYNLPPAFVYVCRKKEEGSGL